MASEKYCCLHELSAMVSGGDEKDPHTPWQWWKCCYCGEVVKLWAKFGGAESSRVPGHGRHHPNNTWAIIPPTDMVCSAKEDK